MEKKVVKFEDKMQELEHIIDDLENGNLDLESSIEKYTNAMKLVNECSDQLSSIEERVTKMVSEDGKITDFKVEE